MIHTTIPAPSGVPIGCRYEYTPGAPQTLTDPADPPEITLVQVFLNGHWVDPEDWLTPTRIEELCDLILGAHQ